MCFWLAFNWPPPIYFYGRAVSLPQWAHPSLSAHCCVPVVDLLATSERVLFFLRAALTASFSAPALTSTVHYDNVSAPSERQSATLCVAGGRAFAFAGPADQPALLTNQTKAGGLMLPTPPLLLPLPLRRWSRAKKTERGRLLAAKAAQLNQIRQPNPTRLDQASAARREAKRQTEESLE